MVHRSEDLFVERSRRQEVRLRAPIPLQPGEGEGAGGGGEARAAGMFCYAPPTRMITNNRIQCPFHAEAAIVRGCREVE